MPPVPANAIRPDKLRIHYIDWLRCFAILGVLLYHSARPFIVEDPWHINDAAKSSLLTEFNFFISRFRMPLLFFISGAVTWLMMQNRTAGGFILLRLKRLFIPLVAGMLLVVPPQVYFERVHHGYTGSYLDFLPTVFTTGSYPEGNFSWHHLWFIAYLFVYDILLAPFFGWCRTARAASFVNSLATLAKGCRVYWLMVPSVLVYSALVVDFPETNALFDDPLYFVYWLLFLLAGYLCLLQPALMESLERNRRLSLSLAFLLLLLINGLRWNDFNWFDGSHPTGSWFTYVYLARHPLHTWCWVFALVGYGRKYLNRPHSALDYINQALYPFYILHQTIIVIIAFYVVQVNDGVAFKWVFIVLSTLFVSLLLFHLFIRPFWLARLLFGMKTRSRQPVPAAAPDPVALQPGQANLKTIVT